jgi:redox-sensitive bicupin YhaK (pirin superfamily)
MARVIDVRRAPERLHTQLDWLDSWHSFSFGHHYDPANVNHGLLLVHNDDTVVPGRGFGMHSHRDMEIVTWVLEGELRHRDSVGNDAVIYPGLAQRMSAGTGITHSEWNASDDAPVHFLQMWVPPDRAGVTPGYEEREIGDALDAGTLVKIAGDADDAALHLHQHEADLWIARAKAGGSVAVPDAANVHLFVARGTAELEGTGALGTGDAVRLARAGTPTVTAGPDGAELVIWATG